MPGARDKLKKVKRKHRMAAEIILPSSDEMFSRSEVGRMEVMSLDEDGTCAYLYMVPAREVAALQTPIGGGGQYAIVVGGSAKSEEEDLTRLSGFYRYGKEDPLRIKAGDEGLCVLLMQFSNNDPL
jgi:hypothetical protein